jgi:hypothetical protein
LLGLDAARREGGTNLLVHVLGDHLARGGVEKFRLVLGGDVADDRAERGIDDDALESVTDRAVHTGGGVGLEPEQQRHVEAHDEW